MQMEGDKKHRLCLVRKGSQSSMWNGKIVTTIFEKYNLPQWSPKKSELGDEEASIYQFAHRLSKEESP
jgi:hypothetical protein